MGAIESIGCGVWVQTAHLCLVSDASNFDKRVREFEKETLDAVKVYEDVQFIEERRRKTGQPPVVRFLTSAEQKRWKRPDSEGAGDKGGNIARAYNALMAEHHKVRAAHMKIL